MCAPGDKETGDRADVQRSQVAFEATAFLQEFKSRNQAWLFFLVRFRARAKVRKEGESRKIKKK